MTYATDTTIVMSGNAGEELPIMRKDLHKALGGGAHDWIADHVIAGLTPYAMAPGAPAPLTSGEYHGLTYGTVPSRWKHGGVRNSATWQIGAAPAPAPEAEAPATPVAKPIPRLSSHRLIDAEGRFYAASDKSDCERLLRSALDGAGTVEENNSPTWINDRSWYTGSETLQYLWGRPITPAENDAIRDAHMAARDARHD